MIQLSVIIPTYNRRVLLERCLQTLFKQGDVDGAWEIVIVVDGSTDDTLTWLKGVQAPCPLRVLTQPNAGAGAARNLGASAAEGTYLLFVDDDVEVNESFVATHLEAHRDRPGIVGLGQLKLSAESERSSFGRYWVTYWEEHYARLRAAPDGVSFVGCYSGNLSISREEFLAAGGFASELRRYEDIEIGYRLTASGLRLVYLDEAIGVQIDHKDLHAGILEFERGGRVALELLRRHPGMLPALTVGGYSLAHLRERIPRSLLLRLGAPMRPLLLIDPVISRTPAMTQWYRFLFRYAYWRGVKQVVDAETWRRLTSGPVILCYHAIGSDREPASRYLIRRSAFLHQMRWLKAHGYHPLALRDYIRIRASYQLPPARSVIVTIDDGYADVTEVAKIVVEEIGVPISLFVVSQRVGRGVDWPGDPATAGRPLLDWDQIRTLEAAGIGIEAHSQTHPDLTTLSADRLRDELVGSVADHLRETGRVPQALAYPFGRFDQDTTCAAEAAGFQVALSTMPRRNSPADPAMQLRRTEIHGTDSMLMFAIRVRLGDGSWLESLVRSLTHRRRRGSTAASGTSNAGG